MESVKKVFSKQILALFLAILTVFSLSITPLETAYALRGYGSQGSPKVTSGSDGSWNANHSGYRMYIINRNGQVVSPVVDAWFTLPAPSNMSSPVSGNEGDYVLNTKFDKASPNNLAIAENYEEYKKYTYVFSVSQLESLAGFSGLPKPQIWSGGGVPNGNAVRQFLLAGMKQAGFGSGVNKGSSSGNTTVTKPSTTKPSTSTGTSGTSGSDNIYKDFAHAADVDAQTARLQSSIVNSFYSLKKLGYSKSTCISVVQSDLRDTIRSLGYSSYWTIEDLSIFSSAGQQTISRLNSLPDWSTTSSKKSAAANISNPFFDIAYAAEGVSGSGETSKGNLSKLVNVKYEGHFLFDVSASGYKIETLNSTGEPDIAATIQANELVFCMEPMWWLRPTNNTNTKYRQVRFVGTITNWGNYLQMLSSEGTFSDGNSKGGWYLNVMNTTGATSLMLKNGVDKPLTGKSESDILINTVSDRTSPLTNAALGSYTDGYGIHYYEGDRVSGLPEIPTYDDPLKEEHPAPDPSSSNIPFTPIEKKIIEQEKPKPENAGKTDDEIIQEWTRTLTIVKCYDVKTSTGDIIHRVSYERANTPGIIHVLNEPSYAVDAWFSSPDYYPDLVGDSVVYTDVTWEQFKTTVTNKTDSKEVTLTDAEIKNVKANTEFDTVKLAYSCDCEPTTAGDDTTRKHFNDNVLYVHLIGIEKEPETSTFDEPNTPAPSPSPDKEFPDMSEPDKDKHLRFRIVKVYESEEADGSLTTDGIFITENTAGIITVEDEAGTPPGYQLIQWMYSNKYNGAGSSWDTTVAGIPALGSGTSVTRVDIRNQSNKSEERTLFVRLRKPYKGIMPGGDIIIQESQISKAIHTDAKDIGGRWGNYKFNLAIGPFATGHTYYLDHGCCGSCDPPCGSCHGHWCSFSMPAMDGSDNKLNFVFAQIGSLDPLQIPQGIHSLTDPVVKSKVNQPETINGLGQSQYSYNSDGNDSKGEELVTVLWRGTSLLNDKPTLVLYKKADIINRLGQQSWDVPQAMLKNESNVSKKTRVKTNGQNMFTLLLTFGIDKGASDIIGQSGCSSSHSGSPASVVHDTRYAAPIGGTDWTYDFQASVNILVYASKAKALADEPFNGAAKKNKTVSTGEHFENTIIQDKQQIKFFPYIKMTYMTNSLKLAELEEQNKTTYVAKSRYETYVLSEYESSILPSDAVEVGWMNNNQEESLLLTSQQWSLHQRAIGGGEAWNGRNQVLPGGAIYQLSTPADRYTNVKAITYQTVVDQKTRQYLSSTLSGTEYTEAQVAKDHTDFINNVKETLDNLRIVQWVDKNYNDTKAWPNNWQEISGDGRICVRGGGESLAELGLALKTNLEDKYYMKKADNLIPYTGKLLGDKTENLMDTSREKANEGDLDIISVNQVTTVFKVFTDTAGNVYMASTQASGVVNTESVIKNLVSQMKDLNADTMSSSGASVVKLFDRKTGWAAANSALTGDAKQIDDRTSFITNIVKALNRNQGSDKTANWAKTDGKWYNEAFDGIYLVRQATTMEIGLKYSGSRASALDPALCPANNGQSDLYTNAFLSQFCLNDKSDATIAQGKDERYIGTFKGVDITMPDMEGMYQSRKFYIPNANVQDLK